MKKLFLLIYFLSFFLVAKAQQWDWAIQEKVRKFAVDSAGNVFTQNDSTIKRFNSHGLFHWQKQFSGDLYICGMAADNSGNLYLAGGFSDFFIDTNHFISSGNRDVFLGKIDSSGTLVWNKIFGGPSNDNVKDIHLTKKNKLIVCGNAGIGAMIGNTLFSKAEFFTSRYDLNGNMETIIHHSGGTAWEVSADTSGNTYLLGGINIDDTLDFGNAVVLYGYDIWAQYGSHFIAKFNAIGDVLWAKDLGDNYYAAFKNLGVDNSGNFYLTKWQRYDGFDLSKFDGSGNFIWNHNTNGTYGDCYSLCVDNNDFIWLTGYIWSHPFSGQPFIWEFNPSNNLTGSVPATVSANGDNIANDYNNNTYVSATFQDTAVFGNTTLIASSGNYFLAKMRSNSNIITSIIKTNILCNGQCSGSISANPSGGHPPYSYLWAPGGQTTATITGMCAGNYTYTVTDSIGNTANATVYITQPSPLLLSYTASNVLCNGQCTGTATVIASGGAPPYNYTGAISDLCASSYTYNVTDMYGCVATTTASISEPPPITVLVEAASSLTYINSTTNLLTGTPAGGTFSGTGVSGTNFNASAAGLGTWTITYTYTDGNGCTGSAAIDITVNLPTDIRNETEESMFEVNPNPTLGIFSVKLKNKAASTKICVFDMLGNCVFDKISNTNSEEVIDLTQQAKGVYTLEIESDGKNVTRKIILQ